MSASNDWMVAIAWICGGIAALGVMALGHFVWRRRRARQKRFVPTTKDEGKITTIRVGPNGRPLYQSKPAPLLPTHKHDVQQNRRSVKNTWKRLSRPFTAAPVEMPQLPPKAVHKSRFSEKFDDVSPMTPRSMDFGRSPVSPISFTNIRASASVTGAIMTNYQSKKYAPNESLRSFHEIPLTPQKVSKTKSADSAPASTKPVRANVFEQPRKAPRPPLALRPLNLGSQRGFLPPSKTLDQGRSNVKKNLVDARNQKLDKLTLITTPKAGMRRLA